MLVLLSSAIQFGMCLPHIEGISTAGGSAQTIFEIIDTVSIFISFSLYHDIFTTVCVRARVCACVRVCVCACVRARVRACS